MVNVWGGECLGGERLTICDFGCEGCELLDDVNNTMVSTINILQLVKTVKGVVLNPALVKHHYVLEADLDRDSKAKF